MSNSKYSLYKITVILYIIICALDAREGSRIFKWTGQNLSISRFFTPSATPKKSYNISRPVSNICQYNKKHNS